MESRYKEEYSQELDTWWPEKKYKYSCHIIDRETGEWMGFASGKTTKKEAKEAAWDDFYFQRKKKKELEYMEFEENKREEEDNDYESVDDYDDYEDDYDEEDDDDEEDENYENNGIVQTYNININNPGAEFQFLSILFGIFGKLIEVQQKQKDNLLETFKNALQGGTSKTIMCFNMICDEIDELGCITINDMIEKCCFNGVSERDAKYVINKFIRTGCLVNSYSEEYDCYYMDDENFYYIAIQERKSKLLLATEDLANSNNIAVVNEMILLLNTPI